MFSLSRAAAEEVRRSMELGGSEGMGLRIAANRGTDGGIHYRMGFDERMPGDLVVQAGGVEVLLAAEHRTLLEGTTMDFVELEPGVRDFIFLNPNDPHYRPPEDDPGEAPETARHERRNP